MRVQDASGNVETIHTTDEHPFFIAGLGLVAAKDLRPGDWLNEADGSNDSRVLSSTREDRPQGVAVYNFEVEGDHTYVVEDGLGLSTVGGGPTCRCSRLTVARSTSSCCAPSSGSLRTPCP